MIDDDKIGKVFQVRIQWDGTGYGAVGTGGYRDSPLSEGGLFQDHGSHSVDWCRWWLGEVKTVSGHIRVIHSKRDIEDLAVAVLEHERGAISVHQMMNVSRASRDEQIEIHGTKGALHMRCFRRSSSESAEPYAMTWFENPFLIRDVTPYCVANIDTEMGRNNQYLNEFEHFFECIQEDKCPSVTGIDGQRAVEIVNAVYLSSYKNTKVTLPLTEKFDLSRIFPETKAAYPGIQIAG